MTTPAIIALTLGLLATFGLLLVAGMRPGRSTVSLFELKRRAKTGGRAAKQALRREQLRVDCASLVGALSVVLLLAAGFLFVAGLGWLWGVLAALLVAVSYGSLSRTHLVRTQSRALYARIEPWLLDVAEKAPRIMRLIRSQDDTEEAYELHSLEELHHLIDRSGGILTAEQRKQLLAGLAFPEVLISEVLAPRATIDSVEHTELLGPLALNDLHKTGHTRFPVVDGDIDHIVGMLDIENLLTLDSKRSVTAATAMDARAFFLREDQTLLEALSAMVAAHQQLFIVETATGGTAGLISLGDVTTALFGRPLPRDVDYQDVTTTARR